MSETPRAERVLLFARGAARFALPEALARGVVPAPKITRVPSAPASVSGLLAWRGEVLPVLEPCGEGALALLPAAVVIADAPAGPIALAVDEISGWHEERGPARLIDLDRVERAARAAVLAALSRGRSEREKR